jgi:chromosome segregation ATPase
MDEPRPTTTEFHCRLRTAFYNLGDECGVTGFEAAGVLSYLAAEVNADNLAAEGLLARGPGLKRRWRNEPEPATPTPEDTRRLDALDELSGLEAKCRELERKLDALHAQNFQQTNALEYENHLLTKKVEELEATVKKLRVDNGTLNPILQQIPFEEVPDSEPAAAADQPVSAAAYIAELEAKCRGLERERGARIDERDELYSKLEKAEVKVAKLESALAENQASYRVLDRDLTLTSQRRVELGERVAALAKENVRLVDELEKAEAKVAEPEESSLKLQREAGKLCESQEVIIADLETRCKSLTKALNGRTQRCESQEKEIDELDRKLQRRESSSLRLAEELKAENIRLTTELADARSKLFTVPPRRFPWLPNPFRI